MRHGKAGRRLGRNSSSRRALATAQATALLREGRIQTTEAKAKELRPYVEKLITTAKSGDLHARRVVGRDIQDKEVLSKLFSEIAPRYAERSGGYTRILKVGVRRGDAAPVALIELV
ncbi:50S ribosomal protein L17 [Deinococcus peraridilitoris]|uniref:Large ribosomal subunit protein bL17 n=1 Tax=Deinococcus peraridilitoris (strain DSM 19664 / LMG 22246 / CIP 109416 / KR-200) TaxID=937777 RepID=L0A503_DEIPD|nr:50S ribosomal protein L17 [Deinococcus peraridilitoris]AFZ68514.1 ribosomal protein L17 [Deinococcus peraridilitoris DSM 19664]